MGVTADYIKELFQEYQKPELEFNGACHDCGATVQIVVANDDSGSLTVEGGSLYKINGIAKPFFKCEGCFSKDPALSKYQPCEIYTRVVGYLRPVQQFNVGKQEEYRARKTFTMGM